MSQFGFRIGIAAWTALGALGSYSLVRAGPIWEESSHGDAGRLPAFAQDTTPQIPLQGIRGRLEGPNLRGPGDFEDMYAISITDTVGFYARTDGGGPLMIGMTTFNTQLFLFDAAGLGILANDDVGPGELASHIHLPDDDGFFPTLPAAGLYYLAITGADNDPLSAAGAIFDQVTTTEVSGPDGVGGAMPIIGWSGPTDPAAFGDYVIEVAPEPASFVLFASAAAAMAIWRRGSLAR